MSEVRESWGFVLAWSVFGLVAFVLATAPGRHPDDSYCTNPESALFPEGVRSIRRKDGIEIFTDSTMPGCEVWRRGSKAFAVACPSEPGGWTYLEPNDWPCTRADELVRRSRR